MAKLKDWWNLVYTAFTSSSTRDFYDRISPIYDRIFTEHKTFAEKITDLLSEKFPGNESTTNVLDVGCGTGMLTEMLVERQFCVTGIDLSLESLSKSKMKNSSIMVTGADAIQLPFDDHSFHATVSLGAWRHFSEPKKVIAELNRVITQEGILIIGYFPPAIGGLIQLKDGVFWELISRGYHALTKKLGYVDRADFELEQETFRLAKNCFEQVHTVEINNTGRLIVATEPIVFR